MREEFAMSFGTGAFVFVGTRAECHAKRHVSFRNESSARHPLLARRRVEETLYLDNGPFFRPALRPGRKAVLEAVYGGGWGRTCGRFSPPPPLSRSREEVEL